MHIKAEFIGVDGSMGFLNGRVYSLQVLRTPTLQSLDIVYSTPPVPHYPIKYTSWKTFWRNWKKDD